MYRLDGRLLDSSETVLGYRVLENDKVKYYSKQNVCILIDRGDIKNATIENGDVVTEADNDYYAISETEFISREEFNKLYHDKVEEDFTVQEQESTESISLSEDTKVYVGLRRLDYKESGCTFSVRIMSNGDFDTIKEVVTNNQFEIVKDWQMDRLNYDYKGLDIINLSVEEVKAIVELFGNSYSNVFENGDDMYLLANISTNNNIYLGRILLPENQLVLISENTDVHAIIPDKVIESISVIIKSVTGNYNFKQRLT